MFDEQTLVLLTVDEAHFDERLGGIAGQDGILVFVLFDVLEMLVGRRRARGRFCWGLRLQNRCTGLNEYSLVQRVGREGRMSYLLDGLQSVEDSLGRGARLFGNAEQVRDDRVHEIQRLAETNRRCSSVNEKSDLLRSQ